MWKGNQEHQAGQVLMKDVSVVCLLLTGPAMRVQSKTVEHRGDTLALLQSGKLVVIWFC